MFKNYIKIALRNLWRNKIFSIINIMGLAVGVTAFFLILLYVRFELNYDSFHSKADRIYRLVCDTRTASGMKGSYYSSAPMAINMKADFPEVESMVRMQSNSILITKGDVKFQENNTLFADSSLFSIFDFPLLKGDPSTALTAPFSIVLSESASKKYFGRSNPLGQIVEMTGWKVPATVTGIMKDIPENSQLKADMLVSLSTVTEKWDTTANKEWSGFYYVSYLLLRPGTSATNLQAKLPAFLEKYDGQEMKKKQMSYTLSLEPLKMVYLHSGYGGWITGNVSYVYIFSVIALFVLLIACFNFINLTTARAAERAKEVGIRKVIGAARGQLTTQFMGESVLLCLVAFLVSMILSIALLPLFNQLAGKTVSPGIFTDNNNMLTLLLITISIGVAAGVYPALVLSAYKPVLVLKGRFASGNKGTLLRKGLVITQFTISIILIIGTIVVYTQLRYMRSQDLGFSKEQTLIIPTNGDPQSPDFKQEVSLLSHVISTSFSGNIPGSNDGMGNASVSAQIENSSGDMQPATLDLFMVDYDYIGQYKMKLVAGRPFSKGFGTDSTQAMILNETAVKELGYNSTQQAINKRFILWGSKGRIVGVVKDFHFNSLREKIRPLCMRESNHLLSYISITLSTADLPHTLSSINEIWKQLIPARPYEYFFLDTFFDRQYRSEDRFGSLFFNFAVLAILISCLGLFGLAGYSTLQRTREIGIRKVLGASVSGIVNLLSRDFLKLVVISFIIASPIAWFAMNKWLQDFAYRIYISWWVLASSGIIALIIACLTVSFLAIRSALANPVNSLRTE